MTSRWVRGTKAPVRDELDVTDLPVEGALPPALDGRLVRMNPNPIGPVADDHNWFAGVGMVHAIDLADGAARRYVNRWVRTPEVSAQLGEPNELPPIDDVDLSNTSARFLAGRLYGLTEGCSPYVLDGDLRTVGRHDFDGGVTHFTAHPHVDADTGEILGVGYRLDDDATCTLYVIDEAGRLAARRDIELLASRSIHDMAFTPNHVVVWDLPVEFDAAMHAAGHTIPYAWNHRGEARVGLIDRHDATAPVRWFDIDPCWVFHPLNAFETDRGVTVDVCQFDTMLDQDRTGPGESIPQLWRWTIDERSTGAGSTEVGRALIDERVQEFPRVDDRVWGRPHRYGYTVELFSSTGAQSIVAHDVDGPTSSWSTEPGRSLSEAIFVPDTPAAGENEGWLLAIDSDPSNSDLVVLDATDVAAGPVARVTLPQRIPDGFHGDWQPATR